MAKKIPNCSKHYKEFLPPASLQSIYIEPVTENELNKIIKELNDGAPGYDEVSAKCIKCVSNHIVSPLVYLTIKSISWWKSVSKWAENW